MSKAFTREDDVAELPPLRPVVSLPPGVKNYITRAGADALRSELDVLQTSRSEAAAANDRPRIQALDQRIAQAQQILGSVTVVEPSDGDKDTVRFGGAVTVKYPSGDLETFRLVGMNEIDLDRNFISWRSPLATALLNKKARDIVTFQAPAGKQLLEIISVE